MRVAERLRDVLTRTDSDTGQPADTTIDPNDAYWLLGNERRRQALAYIVGVDSEWVSLSELAEHLADEDDSDSRKREYISLYQSHVPELDASGVLEYDEQSKEVRSTDVARRVWAAHQAFTEKLR